MVIRRDFRTLAPATQAELRRIAVAMVRAGKTRVEAAATVGVNRRFVGQWVKVAAQGGEAVDLLMAWGGALAYTCQLYFDFSGCSDMAIGAARCFGIRFPMNFDSPYKLGFAG